MAKQNFLNWLLFFVLSIVWGSSFILYYVLIQKAGGLFASLVTYAIPIVAIMWGLLANEYISAAQIGCLAMILAGVYVASVNPSRRLH